MILFLLKFVSHEYTQPINLPPPLLQKRTLHTVVPLATGVVHPPSCRLTTAERHCRQLLEITAELLDVAAKEIHFVVITCFAAEIREKIEQVLTPIINYPVWSKKLVVVLL